MSGITTHLVSVSGGKDSTATLLLARELHGDGVLAAFAEPHTNNGSAPEVMKTSAMQRNGYTKRFRKAETRYLLSGGMDGSNAPTSGETKLNMPANAGVDHE